MATDNLSSTNTDGFVGSKVTNSTSGVTIKNFIAEAVNTSASSANITGFEFKLTGAGGRTGDIYGLFVDYNSLGTITSNRTYGVYINSPYFWNYFAGRVGIGTQSPDSLLTIEKSSAGFWPLGANASDWIANQAYWSNVNSGVTYGYRQHRKARATIATDGYSWDIEKISNGGAWDTPIVATIQSITPDGKLTQNGQIHSTTGGFKFPDGSVQTTASTGGGGGGGASFYSVTLNMGAIGVVTNKSKHSISFPSITATNIINCWLIIEETADHDFDDLENDNIILTCGRIVAGVGFDINATMPCGSLYGDYKIGYSIA